MSTVKEAIVTRLAAYSEVSAIVGTRVYSTSIPQGQSLPACVVTTVGRDNEEAHDAEISAVKKFMQVSCIADSVEVVEKLSVAARHALHDFRGIVAGVTVFYARITNETDLPFDPDFAYQVALDVEVAFRET